MTRKQDWPLVAAIGGLIVALLVCMILLATSSNNYNNDAAISALKKDFEVQLAERDRMTEVKLNRIQEQINSIQFIASKRNDLIDDDLKGIKRDIDDMQQRLKARSK